MQHGSIQFQNVSKQYHKGKLLLKEALLDVFKPQQTETFWALKDINFEVQPGETIGVIGPNGSGKSTLLKLLAGVAYPTKGTVKVSGRVAPLIELGAGFHAELTGRENIYINGTILGLSKKEIDDRIGQIIKFSDLENFIDTPVKHYSSGMYLRLGFSTAIHAATDIILIDEILAVGDNRFQQKSMEALRKLQKQGKTIFLVTHDLSSARSFCDRLIYLKNGKIIEIGNVDSVIDNYIYNIEGAKKTHEPSNEKAELNARKTAEEKKPFTIKKVSFLDKDGFEREIYPTGSPITIHIDFTADKDFDDIVLGIALYSETGNHLYGTNSLVQKRNIYIKQGESSANFQIPSIPILSGKVLVTIAAHSRSGENYHWLDKSYSFNVINPSGDNNGIVDFKAKFSI